MVWIKALVAGFLFGFLGMGTFGATLKCLAGAIEEFQLRNYLNSVINLAFVLWWGTASCFLLGIYVWSENADIASIILFYVGASPFLFFCFVFLGSFIKDRKEFLDSSFF